MTLNRVSYVLLLVAAFALWFGYQERAGTATPAAAPVTDDATPRKSRKRGRPKKKPEPEPEPTPAPKEPADA